jgi:hypothetical protein
VFADRLQSFTKKLVGKHALVNDVSTVDILIKHFPKDDPIIIHVTRNCAQQIRQNQILLNMSKYVSLSEKFPHFSTLMNGFLDQQLTESACSEKRVENLHRYFRFSGSLQSVRWSLKVAFAAQDSSKKSPYKIAHFHQDTLRQPQLITSSKSYQLSMKRYSVP